MRSVLAAGVRHVGLRGCHGQAAGTKMPQSRPGPEEAGGNTQQHGDSGGLDAVESGGR